MPKYKTTGTPAADSNDWEVEDALRTMMRAKEIEKDTKLMEKVRKLAEQKMKAAARFATDTDD